MLVGMLAVLSPGCTRIIVHEGDGNVRVDSGIGIIRLTTQPGRQPQMIQAEGMGIFIRDDAMSIGYFSSDLVMLPLNDCRIVVWVDENTTPELLEIISAQGESICLIGPGA
jgi:hypothetical protein